MKRDFDLIRKLLIFFEEKPGSEPVRKPEIAGYNDIEIMYHLLLLNDAGFLRCEPIKSTSSDRVIKVIPFELTWDGHEFLDKIRSEEIWNKTKVTIKKKGVDLSFDTIRQVTSEVIKSILSTG